MTSTLSSPTTITEFPSLFDTMATSTVTSKSTALPSASTSVSVSVLDSATSSWFGIQDLRLPSLALSLSPPPTTKIESFSWSDFPVIIQEEEEEEEEELISNDSDSISNSDDNDSDSMNYSDDDNVVDDDEEDDDDDDLFSGYTFHTNTMYAPAPASAPTPSTPTLIPTPSRSSNTISRRRNRSTFYDADFIQSSSKNYVQEDEYNGIEEEVTKRARSTAQQYSPTSCTEFVHQHPHPTQRVVQFADYIEVRTYNVVLGDHPWCEDGYAIELGNEVLSIEYQQHHPQQYQSHSPLHRREYLERQRLLMEQLQVTHKELEEQQQQQYEDNTEYENENQHHNYNNNMNMNINVRGLSRSRSIDSCLSRVLNTIVNAAA